jgi:NTE family protein
VYAGDTAVDVSDLVNNKPAFYRFRLNFEKYYSVKKKWAFFYTIQTGISVNSQGFIFDNFYMGGVQQILKQQEIFVGLNEGQITTASVASGLVGMQYNFTGNLFLIGKFNSAIYNFSNLSRIYTSKEVENINGFSLGIAYNLGILPMEFTTMYSPEIGAFYTNVNIGFLF